MSPVCHLGDWHKLNAGAGVDGKQSRIQDIQAIPDVRVEFGILGAQLQDLTPPAHQSQAKRWGGDCGRHRIGAVDL